MFKIERFSRFKREKFIYAPPLLDWVIGPAKADPDWINPTPPPGLIISKGIGSSIGVAKENAEKEGSRQISDAIEKIINQTFFDPLPMNVCWFLHRAQYIEQLIHQK